MTQTHRAAVTNEQWDEAAADYELGKKHGRQIARELGVSPATVTRAFQRRGCQKASRVDEYVAEVLARLDAQAEEKARSKAAADAERKALVSNLVDELFDAFEAGEPTNSPNISRIGWELHLALR